MTFIEKQRFGGSWKTEAAKRYFFLTIKAVFLLIKQLPGTSRVTAGTVKLKKVISLFIHLLRKCGRLIEL